MQIYRKELSDTDSIYCEKPTNSHQSSIFLGPTGSSELYALLGSDYASDMDLVIELSRDNLLLNVLYHYLDSVKYKKRGTSMDWELDKSWLLGKQLTIGRVFRGAYARFHVSVNKETTRTYLKGITSIIPEEGTEKLDFRDYLFSGDVLEMWRKPDNSIVVIVADRGGKVELTGEQQKEPIQESSDCLSVALKLFQQGRVEKAPAGWESFDTWAKEAREAFQNVDEDKAKDPSFDYLGFMRKFAISIQVVNTQFAGHTIDEKAAVLKFLHEQQTEPKIVTWYFNSLNRPTLNGTSIRGMGTVTVLYFMMELHPNLYAAWSDMTYDCLTVVGLHRGVVPKTLTLQNYEDCKAKQYQILAKMHELGIGKAADDDSPADYLTVNEFAWWLSDEKNQNLVKEEMMSKQMKKPNDSCVEDSTKSIVDGLKDKTDTMMARLTASLLTKPFVILAGASGTGKSRMVKKLAYMTCRADMLRNPHDETPGNYCMIAVKPNWHDSSELLGYKSAFAGHEYVSSDFVKFILKAFAFPNTPFFVCLDEMNLAPVEQYFAEYLSAVESVGKNKADEWVGDPLIQRGEFGGDVLNLAPEYELPGTVRTAINEKGLFIPKNLFVVGTVNMDDTTNQFSRKVLDRAMTIMMNEVDFGTLKDGAYEKLTNALRIKNDEIEKFIDRPSFAGSMLDEDFEELLNGIKAALADSPFEIGYRFAIETALYREALAFLTGKTTSEGDGESAKAERNELSQIAFDHLTLMKVLPRMTGTLSERDSVLKDLKTFLGSLGMPQLSAVVLERMKKFAENNGGYISFWP